MSLDQQDFPFVDPATVVSDGRTCQIRRLLIAIYQDRILDTGRRSLTALIRKSKWFPCRNLISKTRFRFTVDAVLSNFVENSNSFVPAYQNVVRIEPPNDWLTDGLVADHGHNFTAAIMVTPPQPIRDSTADFHPGKNVV